MGIREVIGTVQHCSLGKLLRRGLKKFIGIERAFILDIFQANITEDVENNVNKSIN